MNFLRKSKAECEELYNSKIEEARAQLDAYYGKSVTYLENKKI